MDLQGVLVVGGFVVMLGIVVVLVIVGQRRTAQFEKDCRDRGWQVERERGQGFRLNIRGSTSGVNWEYEYFLHRRGSISGGSRRELRSGSVHVDSVNLPGEIVLIMPLGTQASQLGGTIQAMKQFGGLGRTMIELIVVEGLHGDSNDVDRFLALQPSRAGSEALRQHFSVLTTSESAADQLLRRGESALLEFASNPSVKGRLRYATILLWSKGLSLPIERQISDINLLDSLATLIAGLANSVKSGW